MSELVERSLEVLRSAGVELARGLSEDELAAVQRRFGFEFGPDHRRLLLAALPVGSGWVDWRHASTSAITGRLVWPLESALFDVRHDQFWAASWGARPIDEARAIEEARRHLELWPTLVPMYSHRYMPASPVGCGAPVFSVYQTDVIFYGGNLLDYVHREFGGRRFEDGEPPTVDVPPWSLLAVGCEDADL